jgi:hypothetical protein
LIFVFALPDFVKNKVRGDNCNGGYHRADDHFFGFFFHKSPSNVWTLKKPGAVAAVFTLRAALLRGKDLAHHGGLSACC